VNVVFEGDGNVAVRMTVEELNVVRALLFEGHQQLQSKASCLKRLGDPGHDSVRADARRTRSVCDRLEAAVGRATAGPAAPGKSASEAV